MTAFARALAATLFLSPAPAIAQAAQPSPGQAEEVETARALDIALDPKPYLKKRVRITGCTFHSAKLDLAACDIRSRRRFVGLVLLGYSSNDAAGRRRLIDRCAGIDAPKSSCSADIVSDVRLNVHDDVIFLNTRFLWPD